MNTEKQIKEYIDSLPEPKRGEILALHQHMLRIFPGSKLWFLDGTDETGKIVTNPNIGYGTMTIKYADGKSREFYQTGISANTSGISVYIMGIADRTFLSRTFGETLGKAKITGYCIKFRSLKDVYLEVLEAAVRSGLQATATS